MKRPPRPEAKALESWEELKVLIESIDRDLKKAVKKGTKRSGVYARKGLAYAKDLIDNIHVATIYEQEDVKKTKPEHGNKNGPGLLAMLKNRGIIMK